MCCFIFYAAWWNKNNNYINNMKEKMEIFEFFTKCKWMYTRLLKLLDYLIKRNKGHLDKNLKASEVILQWFCVHSIRIFSLWTTIVVHDKAILNVVHVAMWLLVMYSNYFEIVSTMTFLISQTRLSRGKFVFNAVLPYHYTISND